MLLLVLQSWRQRSSANAVSAMCAPSGPKLGSTASTYEGKQDKVEREVIWELLEAMVYPAPSRGTAEGRFPTQASS